MTERTYRVAFTVTLDDAASDPEDESDNVIRAIEQVKEWMSTWAAEDPWSIVPDVEEVL